MAKLRRNFYFKIKYACKEGKFSDHACIINTENYIFYPTVLKIKDKKLKTTIKFSNEKKFIDYIRDL
jgi:hypothetical protein